MEAVRAALPDAAEAQGGKPSHPCWSEWKELESISSADPGQHLQPVLPSAGADWGPAGEVWVVRSRSVGRGGGGNGEMTDSWPAESGRASSQSHGEFWRFLENPGGPWRTLESSREYWKTLEGPRES